MLKAASRPPKAWCEQTMMAPSLLFLVEVSSSPQTLALLSSSPLFMPNPDSCAGPGETGLFLQDTTVQASQILI